MFWSGISLTLQKPSPLTNTFSQYMHSSSAPESAVRFWWYFWFSFSCSFLSQLTCPTSQAAQFGMSWVGTWCCCSPCMLVECWRCVVYLALHVLAPWAVGLVLSVMWCLFQIQSFTSKFVYSFLFMTSLFIVWPK